MMSELTLQQVSYRYPGGSRYALDGISGTFSAGKLYAVIGPSGSGKSTLLSLMAGLDRPTEGSLQLNGSDYRSLNLDRCRRQEIAMIFQAFQLFPLLTVLENVCFPMEANGVKQKEAKAKAKELLTSVGISEEQHQRYPANLSGGEQQRVAIARALSSGAGIILADEPTGNLDTANGNQVMEILLRLAHEEGRCVIVVTHDMDIAAQADEVWRMKDGALALEA
ncbi:MAG: ABC transporter ATP-binding protein [Evtepia gabavorous]|jgi:ABC-type lipoprotein export system ATPase subunit